MMRELTVVAILIAFGVGMVMTVPFAAVAQTPGDDPGDVQLAPGERLMGVIGIHDAELANEVDERAFGLSVAQAATLEAQADIVAERLTTNEERLNQLEAHLEELQALREAGEIGEGRFQAEVARLEAEREGIERLTNETQSVAEGLPVELLEEKGINASAILDLRERASELGGQEVRDIARSIAGNGVGAAAGDRPNISERIAGNARGAGDQVAGAPNADQAVQRAERWFDRATATVQRAATAADRSPVGDGVAELLDDANAELEAADTELELAREALDAGDDEAAVEHAVNATDHATQAIELANEVLDESRGPPADVP